MKPRERVAPSALLEKGCVASIGIFGKWKVCIEELGKQVSIVTH